MARKNGNVGGRAWKLLRLALLWAGKGGVFRRSLMAEVPKFLKTLGHTTTTTTSTPRFLFHRQLSFDKTPIIHAKMHRPSSMRFNIPCITSQVDFDYDFNIPDDEDEDRYGNDDCEQRIVVAEEDKGNIDMRAEEFIAKFYNQMKLQRQLSYMKIV